MDLSTTATFLVAITDLTDYKNNFYIRSTTCDALMSYISAGGKNVALQRGDFIM